MGFKDAKGMGLVSTNIDSTDLLRSPPWLCGPDALSAPRSLGADRCTVEIARANDAGE